MLDSAAIGAIIGAAARAGPEILKFVDRHLDRRHELAMMDKTIALESLPASTKAMAKSSIEAGQLQEVFGLMREAYRQQFDTGNPWLNAVSILVRPTTTAVLVWLYVGIKAAMACTAMATATPVDSLLRIWTSDDMAILSAILSFWFMSRTIERRA